ncbi:MAG: type IV secretion system protein [Rickettsiaceae bacterium]|nr:type IV secretion system protein [Rickettsiaceae bacterium]
MSGKKLIIIGLLALAGILLCLVLAVVAIIGIVFISDGCFYRYSYNPDAVNDSGVLGTDNPEDIFNDMITNSGAISTKTTITNTVTLKANGNYNSSSAELNHSITDSSLYGKWLNTNLKVKSGQEITMRFTGEISLCRAYLPSDNIQTISNTDIEGNRIMLPRVGETSAEPIYLMLNAQNNEWRNIAELYKGDHVVITLKRDQITSSSISSMYDVIDKKIVSANCTENQTSYSPICGRYSSWNPNNQYVDRCEFVAECIECNIRQECDSEIVAGICTGSYQTVSDMCSCFTNHYAAAPAAYLNNGKHTYPWSDNINNLQINLHRDCATEQEYVDGDYQNQQYFWYSANNAAGLLYRFELNSNSAGQTALGTNYHFANNPTISSGNDNVIFDGILSTELGATNTSGIGAVSDAAYNSDLAYLQYRLYTHSEDAINTGGYVLGIKHTKCNRRNGESFSDNGFGNRGQIEYSISSSEPNDSSAQSLNVDNGSAIINANNEGNLWLRIKNKPEDYKDSFGQYNVTLITQIETGNFLTDILTPFLNGFKNTISDASTRIFQNMTCLNNNPNNSNCMNFFNYIKGILSLYIMGYGFMFLMGMVQISQTDLVIRVIKVGVVAGLMSGATFEFFRDYVFNTVTSFADEIIANMSGYSIFTEEEQISNPLAFMAEVLSNILLNPTFSAQIMALLSMGISGIVYFIIMIIAIGILLIVLFRSITIYLMAFMALAVLMGIAPLFLTFILFEKTKYMFDNWIKYCFKYMLEPVVLMAGIIVLTQLITIFLDNILSYSVCWKCVLPFKLPFSHLEGIAPALLNIDIFCIEWFAPWGYDPRESNLAINLQYIVILLILVYALWGYTDFSSQLVSRITESFGTPTATSMGQSLNSAIESKALKTTGLDAQSRAKMKQSISASAKSHSKAIKQRAIQGKIKDKVEHEITHKFNAKETKAPAGDKAKTNPESNAPKPKTEKSK